MALGAGVLCEGGLGCSAGMEKLLNGGGKCAKEAPEHKQSLSKLVRIDVAGSQSLEDGKRGGKEAK